MYTFFSFALPFYRKSDIGVIRFLLAIVMYKNIKSEVYWTEMDWTKQNWTELISWINECIIDTILGNQRYLPTTNVGEFLDPLGSTVWSNSLLVVLKTLLKPTYKVLSILAR